MNCGVQSALNFPTIAPGQTTFVSGERRQYRYKWIAGNNKPTVRGDYFNSVDSVDSKAVGWRADGFGYYHANDHAGNGTTVTNATTDNALRANTTYPVDLNPLYDCTADVYVPTVDTTP